MKHLLSQPHMIMSVENSPYPDKVRAQVSHENAIGALNHIGGGTNNVHSIQGHYGGPERSIFISNPTPHQRRMVHRLAAVTGQDSVIHSNGLDHQMIYGRHSPQRNSIVRGKGTVYHQDKPKDFYSTLPSGEHFTHNFDFDKPGKFGKAEAAGKPVPVEADKKKQETARMWKLINKFHPDKKLKKGTAVQNRFIPRF